MVNNHLGELRLVLWNPYDMVYSGLGDSHCILILATHIHMEIQVVSEDNTIEGGLIAVELLLMLSPAVEVSVIHIFGL